MEKIQLKVLASWEIEPMWPKIGPWILTAVGEEADQSDVKYIQQQACNGTATVWILFGKQDIEAVLVTETAFYGGRRTLVLRWMSGKLDDNWLEILAFIENWAATNQFERTEVWGRKGWERALRSEGYSHEFTVLGKSLLRSMH